MKTIQLTQGAEAIVSDEDFESLNAFKWHLGSTGYARRTVNFYDNGKRKTKIITMHRSVFGAESGQEIDHINRNRLDNRRENMRLATRAQNCANRTKPKNNSTGVKGVQFRKDVGKYTAALQRRGNRKFLGYFTTLDAAKEAYLSAAREIFGEFAHT